MPKGKYGKNWFKFIKTPQPITGWAICARVILQGNFAIWPFCSALSTAPKESGAHKKVDIQCVTDVEKGKSICCKNGAIVGENATQRNSYVDRVAAIVRRFIHTDDNDCISSDLCAVYFHSYSLCYEQCDLLFALFTLVLFFAVIYTFVHIVWHFHLQWVFLIRALKAEL